MSESVGKISLDLEIAGDIGQQLQNITGNMSQQLNNAFSGAFSGFKNGTNSINNSIKKSFSGMSGASDQFEELEAKISQATEEAQRLEEELRKMGEEKEQGVSSSKILDLKEKIAQTEAETKSLSDEMEKLANTQVPTEKYAELEEMIRKTSSKLSTLLEKQEKLEAIGVNKKGSQWKGLVYDIVKAEEALNRYLKRHEQMEAWGSNLKSGSETEDYSKISAKYDTLIEQVEQYKKKLEEAMQKEEEAFNKKLAAKEEQYQKLTDKVDALKAKYDELNKSGKKSLTIFEVFEPLMKKNGNAADKTRRSFIGLNKASRTLSAGIFTLGKMFKMLVLRMAIRGIINGMKEGMQNLAQYSSSVNARISSLISALTQLKNSFATAFAPILSVVAPILTTLINMLSQAVTYIGMFFAALTGQKSFVKAKAVQQDYAAGLSSSASNAKKATEATKEYQKQLMGFDEINQLQEDKTDTGSDSGSGGGYTGPSIGEMFETVEIDSKLQVLADKIKGVVSQFIKPFKEAWAKEGQATIDSMEYAFGSVWELIKSIGRDFLVIWTNGTGTKLLSTILQILQDIFNVVGNLANRFREAWEQNDVGKRIIQGVLDIFQVVLDTIKKITGATVEWSKNLNFSPLLEAVARALETIKPVVEIIGDTLAWIWTDCVLPFLSWLIETAIPNILNGLSGLFEFLSNNQGIVEGITIAVVSFFAAFKIATTIAGVVSALGAAIGFLTSPIGAVIVIMGALVAAGLILYKNWDSICAGARIIWDNVKVIFQQFGDFLTGIFTRDWTGAFGVLGDGMNAFFRNISNVVNSIKQAFNGVITFLKGVFTGNWKQAFQGLSDILKGMFNGMVSVVKAPMNAIIGIINGVITGLNGIKLPSWVPGIGGKGINIPKIPYLAKGGVVDSPTLAMIGENGQEAVVPLENNTGWINSMASKLSEQMGAGVAGVTKEELESIMTNVGSMIVSALNGLGFYVDSEEIAKATQKGMAKVNRRYNTAEFY